jgi:AcrR family transcriptional regulator
MLRATPQQHEERQRVRQALLRAALSLGAQHGFSSLGLREVSRAASIAPTSFYRHFSEMTELGRALVDDMVRPMLRSIAEQAAAAEDAAAVAGRLVEGMLAGVTEDPELVRFMVAERVGASSSLRAALGAEVEALAESVRGSGKRRARPARAAPVRPIPLAIVLLLEGFTRALELAPAERTGLRKQLTESLTLVLESERT